MQKSIHHWLDLFRLQISSPDAIFPLSILGMIAGVFAALTIIVLPLPAMESEAKAGKPR